MKKAIIRKKPPFFTLAVLVLSLVLLYRIASCVQEIRFSMNYTSRFSASDYEYALQYKDYAYLNRIARNDSSSSTSEFVLACRSIADYYEASILYHAYDTAKNNAAASKELQRMTDDKADWPDYEGYFQDIDQLFVSVP